MVTIFVGPARVVRKTGANSHRRAIASLMVYASKSKQLCFSTGPLYLLTKNVQWRDLGARANAEAMLKSA